MLTCTEHCIIQNVTYIIMYYYCVHYTGCAGCPMTGIVCARYFGQ